MGRVQNEDPPDPHQYGWVWSSYKFQSSDLSHFGVGLGFGCACLALFLFHLYIAQ